jgi:23S rRNA pseudoU1915 N3-methylase RlmH
MRYHIIAVGRLRRGVEGDLFQHFQGRIRWPLDIHEIDDRKSGSDGRKVREGKSILAAIPDGAMVAALDEKGRDLSSEDCIARSKSLLAIPITGPKAWLHLDTLHLEWRRNERDTKTRNFVHLGRLGRRAR